MQLHSHFLCGALRDVCREGACAVPQGLGFYVGDFFVAYYGLLIAAGIAAAAVVGWLQVRRFGKCYDDFILLAAVGGLGGILGAKLLYILVSIEKIEWARLADWDYLNAIMAGGFVFYGGLIGGMLGLFFCRKILHVDVWGYLQICIPCLPIAHGFGRLGCSLAGCCYGRPYDGWAAVVYRDSPFAPNCQPLFPVQALEAVLDFAIAAVLLLYIDWFRRKRALQWYLILYAAARFALEFARYDSAERGMLAGLSTSQYISLGLLVGVGCYLLFQKGKTGRSSLLPGENQKRKQE